MRIVVNEFMSLDGVVQAPGGAAAASVRPAGRSGGWRDDDRG
jgi:hypothetical protein